MKQIDSQTRYYCDVCKAHFTEQAIHIGNNDFCSWDCCHSKKGQKLLGEQEKRDSRINWKHPK